MRKYKFKSFPKITSIVNPFTKKEIFPNYFVKESLFWKRRDFSMVYFMGFTILTGIQIWHSGMRDYEWEGSK